MASSYIHRDRRGTRPVLLALCLTAVCACASPRPAGHDPLHIAAEQGSALAVSDALEALIAAGEDTARDREFAYAIVRQHDEDTAETMFARAVVTGRLVQQRGWLAVNLVPEVERAARRSRELD